MEKQIALYRPSWVYSGGFAPNGNTQRSFWFERNSRQNQLGLPMVNGSPLSLGKLEGGKVYKVRPNGSNLKLNYRWWCIQSPVWNNDGTRIVLIKGTSEASKCRLQRTAFRGTSDLIWPFISCSGNNFICTYRWEILIQHFNQKLRFESIYRGGGFSNPPFGWHRWESTISGDRKSLASWFFRCAKSGLDKNAREGDQALAAIGMDLFCGHSTSCEVISSKHSDPPLNAKNASLFPLGNLTDIVGQFPAWGWDNTCSATGL